MDRHARCGSRTLSQHTYAQQLTSKLCAGAPLQVSKRQLVIPMLYLLTFLWLVQTLIMSARLSLFSCSSPLHSRLKLLCVCAVYGTVVLQYTSPLCYHSYGGQQGHVRNLTRTMIYTIWAFAAVTACATAQAAALPRHAAFVGASAVYSLSEQGPS